MREFSQDVQIYAIIPEYADLSRAKNLIDNDAVTVLQDRSDSLALVCGVYATPQAVIIDAQQLLYYRGNYNSARYCTAKESSFAQLALRQLLQGHEPPIFNALATQSYGCELPANEKQTSILLNILP